MALTLHTEQFSIEKFPDIAYWIWILFDEDRNKVVQKGIGFASESEAMPHQRYTIFVAKEPLKMERIYQDYEIPDAENR